MTPGFYADYVPIRKWHNINEIRNRSVPESDIFVGWADVSVGLSNGYGEV